MYIYHKLSARDRQAIKDGKQEALKHGTAAGFTDCPRPTGVEVERKGLFHIDVESSIERNNQSYE